MPYWERERFKKQAEKSLQILKKTEVLKGNDNFEIQNTWFGGELVVENIYGMMSDPFVETINVVAASQGDLNLDDIINIVDVVILVNIILDNTTPTDIQSNLADMNYDGNINISDIILLINTILS